MIIEHTLGLLFDFFVFRSSRIFVHIFVIFVIFVDAGFAMRRLA